MTPASATQRDRAPDGLVAALLAAVAMAWLWGSGAFSGRVVRFTDGAYSYLSWAVDRRGPGALYDHLALSQPPLTVLLGALAWHVHGAVVSLRLLEGACDALVVALTFLLARRLGLGRVVAVGAALLAMTAPVRNLFGGLDGELLVTPVVLAATLLTLRGRWVATGVLVGVLALVKLTAGPFALALLWPAVRGGRTSATRALAAAVATAVVGWGALLVAFGWSPARVAREVVGAQGAAGLQLATWPVLVVVALVAWWPLLAGAGAGAGNRDLARTLRPLLLAGVACLALMAKSGTYFNVLAPAEPLVAIIAAAGIGRLLATPGRAVLLGRVLVVLLVARAVTIASAPVASALPFPLGARLVSLDNERQVDAAVSVTRARARASDAVLVDPLVALRAGRREVDDQADWFILHALGDRCVVRDGAGSGAGRCVTWTVMRDRAFHDGDVAVVGVEPNVWAFDRRTHHPDRSCLRRVAKLRHGPFALDLWVPRAGRRCTGD